MLLLGRVHFLDFENLCQLEVIFSMALEFGSLGSDGAFWWKKSGCSKIIEECPCKQCKELDRRTRDKGTLDRKLSLKIEKCSAAC